MLEISIGNIFKFCWKPEVQTQKNEERKTQFRNLVDALSKGYCDYPTMISCLESEVYANNPFAVRAAIYLLGLNMNDVVRMSMAGINADDPFSCESRESIAIWLTMEREDYLKTEPSRKELNRIYDSIFKCYNELVQIYTNGTEKII